MSTSAMPPKSPWRAIIETAMYANSVRTATMDELYGLALMQPEVVATDHPMHEPAALGLPDIAKVLVSNDGAVTGLTEGVRLVTRRFSARQSEVVQAMLREAVYRFNLRRGLHVEAIVGLHQDFMVKAHIVGPESDAKNLMDWGMNFTPFISPHNKTYAHSRVLEGPDIIVFTDPGWQHPEYPGGCVVIDEEANCAAVLGLRYFGELRKATLTLAWAIGIRHNMVACHGGIKKIGENPPVAVFGLAGSGKSSITNSLDHGGTLGPDEDVTVIHDDAFLVDLENDFSVALEPSLFEKTGPIGPDDPELKYFYSAHNVGVTRLADGTRVMVNSDVRNENGRCIKSRDIFKNATHCQRPGIVVWLQQDMSLPPICKVKGSHLAVALGATLSAAPPEHTNGGDVVEGRLNIEPFANPFRVHSLLEDCEQFRKLFKAGCECYIMNTHAFTNTHSTGEPLHDIPKELSLAILTALVRGEIKWREWRTLHGLFIPKNGTALFGDEYDKRFRPNRSAKYLRFLRDRLQERITFLSNKRDEEQEMSNNFIAPLVSSRNTIDKLVEPDLYV